MAFETQQQGWLNNFESKSSKCITVADPRHLHLSSQKTFHTCLQRSNRMAYLHFPAEQFYRKYEGWCFWVTNLVCYFMQFCFLLHLWLSKCYFVLYKHYRFDQALCNLSQESWRQTSWYLIQRYVVHGCFSVFFHVFPSCNLLLVLPLDSQSYSCTDKIKGLNLWGSCYIYQLSLRTVYWYCFSCCDVGLGWLQVWFQEVRWQEELGLDATVWFVDSQEFFSNQHHCLHGITLSYSWWTRYMLHLSREALQNASAEVCCITVYYAFNTCFTLTWIPKCENALLIIMKT